MRVLNAIKPRLIARTEPEQTVRLNRRRAEDPSNAAIKLDLPPEEFIETVLAAVNMTGCEAAEDQ